MSLVPDAIEEEVLSVFFDEAGRAEITGILSSFFGVDYVMGDGDINRMIISNYTLKPLGLPSLPHGILLAQIV